MSPIPFYRPVYSVKKVFYDPYMNKYPLTLPIGNGYYFYRFVAPALLLLALLYSFGNLTLVLSQRTPFLMPLEKISSPHYGPFQSPPPLGNWYRFNSAQTSMGNFPLWRIQEMPMSDFQQMMLSNVPPRLRTNCQKYLSVGLKTAEKYQIDPFWVMAIMWVESHFKPQAKSHMDAIGLMQVLPGTGHFIHQLMGTPLSPGLSYAFVKDPHHNIELGVFYLKHLLKRFKQNHTLATIAYNMGPTTVQKRLQYRLPLGVKNNYLDKVREAYFLLSRSYRLYVNNNPPEYTKTYAAHPDRIPSKSLPKNFLASLSSLAWDDHIKNPPLN